jgi:tRNA(Ile)-lysidine synthase
MQSFTSHILRVLQSHGVDREQPVIVAVSGGADSMALLHVMHASDYSCIGAHVNYGLRGTESDDDERAVHIFCAERNITLETLHVTEEDWKQHEGSTQEAARAIRYVWFKSLLSKHNASIILTAHHANDQTETMLYQFVRGGAGKSVFGMAEKSGNIIRPMLAITKERVLQYIAEHAIPWRQDSSNETTHYTRNVVRLEWMPLIERLNPTIHETIQQRSTWMHQEQAVVEWGAQIFLEKNTTHDGVAEVMTIASLRTSGFMDVVLWKWLSPRGFSSQQVMQVAEHVRNEPSPEATWFYSATHRVCLQGGRIACAEIVDHKTEVIQALPWSNDRMSIDFCSASEVEFTTDSNRQYVDASKMNFPLIIRTWQDGDRFHPLGALGQKKVSDFLVHAKIPSWRKHDVFLFQSDGETAVVLKHRISEKFKKTEATERCVRIQFL